MERLRPVADRVMGSRALRWVGQVGREDLTVLAYHGVPDPLRFRVQMEALCEGWRPVTLEEAMRWGQGQAALPPAACLVTFDDGDPTVLEVAGPILKELGVPAVAFVVTDLVGSENPYWWVEVDRLLEAGSRPPKGYPGTPRELVSWLKKVPNQERLNVVAHLRGGAAQGPVTQRNLSPAALLELEDLGIAVANHTASHPCLDQCMSEEIQDELLRSHRQLTDWLGRPPTAFAYPNGNWDERATRLLSDLGYQAAYLFDHRVAKSGTHPLLVSRLRLGSQEQASRFRAVASGVHPRLHAIRGRA